MDATSHKTSFWRSLDLFAGLDTLALQALAGLAQRREWMPGEILFQRGDPGHWMVALAEGRVKLTLLTPQGRELILRHAEAGDSLGEFALVDGLPRSADATAVTAVTGWVLDSAGFAKLVTAHPVLGMAAARYFCRRLRETTDQLEGMALYPLEARLARFFMFALHQINGDELPETAVLRLDITQGDLAALVGASRPKVNRALQSLQEAGALLRVGEDWQVNVALLQPRADPEA
jgi:CRP/FNR family cyclic AMP-dependent transcriptional regulator